MVESAKVESIEVDLTPRVSVSRDKTENEL